MAEVAEKLSTATGKPIRYVDVAPGKRRARPSWRAACRCFADALAELRRAPQGQGEQCLAGRSRDPGPGADQLRGLCEAPRGLPRGAESCAQVLIGSGRATVEHIGRVVGLRPSCHHRRPPRRKAKAGWSRPAPSVLSRCTKIAGPSIPASRPGSFQAVARGHRRRRRRVTEATRSRRRPAAPRRRCSGRRSIPRWDLRSVSRPRRRPGKGWLLPRERLVLRPRLRQ